VFSVIYAMVERRQLAGVIRIRRRVLIVLRVHLVKASGDKRLDEISTEDVQRLKAALTERAPKTVNNVLTVLSVVLRTAVEWRDRASRVLDQDAESAEEPSELSRLRRVRTARESGSVRSVDPPVILLGGQAGLRCGEIMALEWSDIDFAKRQLTVARSEWKGH
jgi:integrase